MRTRAAIIREPGKPWEITELELDEPRAGEVRITFRASGMCHSDEHLRTGDSTGRLPMVGGHEGAGVIEAVGPGRDPRQGRRPRGLLVHPRLRDLPVLLDRAPEPVRLGRADDDGDAGGRDVQVPRRRRRRPRRLLHARHVRRAGGDLAELLRPDREGHPVRGGGADRLRRADRLGHGGLRGRRPGRADGGDLRRRRRRHQRRPGRAVRRGRARHRGRPGGVQAGERARPSARPTSSPARTRRRRRSSS